MSRGPSESRPPSEEEKLSGTLFGGLQYLASALGGLSTAFALVGIIGLVLGVIILIFIPDLRPYSYIIMGAGGALVLVSVAMSFRTVTRAITGRRGRYGTNTAIMVTAFLGITVVVSFLAFDNNKRIDVTATKQFSLAPRTVELLKNLKEPVQAKAFFGPASSPNEEAFRNQIDDLLHEFKVRTGKFSYEFIDPDIDPLSASEYKVTRYGTIVFESMESKKRHPVFPSAALEQEFVTGLLIITGQKQKQVFFLTGHGEADTQNPEPNTEGFGLAYAGITNENYAVSTINLILQGDREELLGKKDSEASGTFQEIEDRREKRVNMLVVAAPKNDLLEGESQMLDDYLKSGGNLLLLLEPGTPQTFRDFLARWGIVVSEGRIVDKQRFLGERNEITVLTRDQYFNALPQPLDRILAITDLTARLDTTYYPGVAALRPAEEGVVFFPPEPKDEEQEEEEEEKTPTVFGTALAFTSVASWLIDDPTRNDPQEGDPRGPFYPAVAIRAIAPLDGELPSSPEDVNPASIVVFGDSDFATNRYFYTSSNSDFFLNSVNWLVGDIALADIRPKPLAFRELVLTRNEFDFMRYSSWFLLPALMAVAGGLVWWRRR